MLTDSDLRKSHTKTTLEYNQKNLLHKRTYPYVSKLTFGGQIIDLPNENIETEVRKLLSLENFLPQDELLATLEHTIHTFRA